MSTNGKNSKGVKTEVGNSKSGIMAKRPLRAGPSLQAGHTKAWDRLYEAVATIQEILQSRSSIRAVQSGLRFEARNDWLDFDSLTYGLLWLAKDADALYRALVPSLGDLRCLDCGRFYREKLPKTPTVCSACVGELDPYEPPHKRPLSPSVAAVARDSTRFTSRKEG
jgi:hypothetical protein